MSSRRSARVATRLPGFLCCLLGLLLAAGPAEAAGPLPSGFVVVDLYDGVIHVDRTTGTATPLAAVGALLPCPVGILVESPDSILVSTVCSPGIVRYRVSSGNLSLVASGPLIPNPDGMALAGNRLTLYETDLTMGAVVEVDLPSGLPRVIQQGGLAANSPFIAVGADAMLYLGNRVSGTGRIVRVDPAAGTGAIVTSGGHLDDPKGIALAPSGDLIVVDLGTKKIVRVDPATGTQTLVASGGWLSAPYAIAVGNDDQAFVTNLFNGNIVQIDLGTGAQSLIQVAGLTAAYGISIYGAPGSPSPGPSPTPPPAPTSCVASDDRLDGVAVTWAPVAEAATYCVYRGAALLAQLPSSALSYFDAPPVGAYEYCVRAVNLSGISAPACDTGARALPEGGLPPGVVIVDYLDGVMHVDRATGAVTPLAVSGGLAPCPTAVVVEGGDSLLLATVCAPAVVRHRIASGAQSVVASGPLIPNPDGMALDGGGTLLYETDLTMGAVVEVDLVGGGLRRVTEGGLAAGSPFIAMGADRQLYLANRWNSIGRIVRVDPATGAEEVISSGGYLDDPKGIALAPSGDLIVVDLDNHVLLRVDPFTGAQQVVTGGGWLSDPYAVAVDNDDQAFVTNLNSGDVVRVDLASGQQSLIQVPGLTAAYGIAVYGAPGSPKPDVPLPPPAPDIQFVRDVPHDQGGRVLVGWLASRVDTAPAMAIASYTLWRRVTEEAAQALLRDGARRLEGYGEAAPAVTGRALRVTRGPTGQVYWEYIVTVPARGVPAYAYTASTTADSMPGLVPWNVFFVDAEDRLGHFFVSEPDSGYSVDNLSPAVPQSLSGTYSSAWGVTLHWAPNAEADLSHYAVYRGLSPDFEPEPENLVGTTRDTVFADAVGSIHSYKVAAVDVHANPSAFALLGGSDIPVGTLVARFDAAAEAGGIRLRLELLQQDQEMAGLVWRGDGPERGASRLVTTDPVPVSGGRLEYLDASARPGGTYWYWVDLKSGGSVITTAGPISATALETAPRVTLASPAAPNPASSGAVFAYVIGSDVAGGGAVPVSLKLYDLKGRLVRTLKDASETAGDYRVEWDGRSDAGLRVGPGVYQYRFQAGIVVRGFKVVVL